MRFNWFGFWARDTTQQIDTLHKAQVADKVNRPSPTTDQGGTVARTRTLLPASSEVLSRGYGQWNPSSDVGDCPKWLHDTYWVKADDGKVYATWHPAVDFNVETGNYCTFGHEHGSDPLGSDVFSIAGMPPFGYVNENHEPTRLAFQRNEDHVGHKVLVANNWMLDDGVGGKKVCDLMIKAHVGTHSPDALTNAAHEMQVAGKCEGLEPFSLKYFASFGTPGTFKEAEASGCGQYINTGIAPTPSNQVGALGHRAIPTLECYLRGTSADLSKFVDRRSIEYWYTNLVGGTFYYTIANPSRLYDPASPTKTARQVDLCYLPTHPLAATQLCQETVAASSNPVLWNDTRSSFRGSVHTNSHFSRIRFLNSPTAVVYTNAWGQGSRSTPDPANGVTIKQLVPTIGFNYSVSGQASVIPNVDHSAGGRNGVRSPN
jgi:hypothetical protein